MKQLAAQGAHEVIAYADDDAPPGAPERDRTPANRLYDSMGFQEVERFWSFTRRQSAPTRRPDHPHKQQ